MQSLQENEGAYGAAGQHCSAIFRSLCKKFRVSPRCLESLVEDGWDDPSQCEDISAEWKEQILLLAPNGGQKRNLEKMLERVEAGPLDERVPKKKAKVEASSQGDGSNHSSAGAAAGAEAGAEAAPSGTAKASGKPPASSTPSTSQVKLLRH